MITISGDVQCSVVGLICEFNKLLAVRSAGSRKEVGRCARYFQDRQHWCLERSRKVHGCAEVELKAQNDCPTTAPSMLAKLCNGAPVIHSLTVSAALKPITDRLW
jgi:hypothetical protein